MDQREWDWEKGACRSSQHRELDSTGSVSHAGCVAPTSDIIAACAAAAVRAANICEGFDHAEAPPTDKDEAARQLRLATAQEYRMVAAAKPSKRQPHPPPPSAVVAATAAAAGVPLPQAAAPGAVGNEAADSGSSSHGSSDKAAVRPSADGACSSAEPHSKAAATRQARLLRLQQPAPLHDTDDSSSQA
jgi:hypothetical protein